MTPTPRPCDGCGAALPPGAPVTWQRWQTPLPEWLCYCAGCAPVPGSEGR